MTGYTVHTGSNDEFASGWDRIFGGQPAEKQARGSQAKKGKAARKAAQPAQTDGSASARKGSAGRRKTKKSRGE